MRCEASHNYLSGEGLYHPTATSVCCVLPSLQSGFLCLSVHLQQVAALKPMDFEVLGVRACPCGLASLHSSSSLLQLPTTGPVSQGLGTKSGTFIRDWPRGLWRGDGGSSQKSGSWG